MKAIFVSVFFLLIFSASAQTLHLTKDEINNARKQLIANTKSTIFKQLELSPERKVAIQWHPNVQMTRSEYKDLIDSKWTLESVKTNAQRTYVRASFVSTTTKNTIFLYTCTVGYRTLNNVTYYRSGKNDGKSVPLLKGRTTIL